MANLKLKESVLLAIPVTAAVWIISYLFSLFKLGTITGLFTSVPATSVVTGTVGAKILAVIGGVVPIGTLSGMEYLTIYISAIVAILIGSWAIEGLRLPVFRGFMGYGANEGKIAATLIYGAIPIYAILVGFVAPSLMTFVGVAIHTLLVAFVTVALANIVKMKI